MNPFEMILITAIVIVALAMTTSIIMRAMALRHKGLDSQSDGEKQLVADLHQRIKVLEQIVTDRGAETAAQIEALRDQARIPMKDETP